MALLSEGWTQFSFLTAERRKRQDSSKEPIFQAQRTLSDILNDIKTHIQSYIASAQLIGKKEFGESVSRSLEACMTELREQAEYSRTARDCYLQVYALITGEAFVKILTEHAERADRLASLQTAVPTSVYDLKVRLKDPVLYNVIEEIDKSIPPTGDKWSTYLVQSTKLDLGKIQKFRDRLSPAEIQDVTNRLLNVGKELSSLPQPSPADSDESEQHHWEPPQAVF